MINLLRSNLFIFQVTYVDDILLAGKSTSRMKEVKCALAAQFDIKDLGELHYLLGVTVKQDVMNKSINYGLVNQRTPLIC